MYEDTPDDTVHDLASRAAYHDHPLAYSILGTAERLNAMGPDHLRQYMSERYRIDDTVISVAGNVGEEVLELLEQHFGRFDVKGPDKALEAPKFHSRALFHRKKTEQNHLCLTFPGCSIQAPNLYAMILLNNTIGGGMSSRLFQEIREKRGLAYSVILIILLMQIVACSQCMREQLLSKHRMSTILPWSCLMILPNGFERSRTSRGKEQLKGNLILSLESTSSRMNRLGKNELMLGRHYTLDEMLERIDQVELIRLE